MNAIIAREIPCLQTTILRAVAKDPPRYMKCVDSSKLSAQLDAVQNCRGIDFIELLVNQITETGRFTDDAMPPALFLGRKVLVFRNSKVSRRYLETVIDLCCSTMLTLDLSGCFQVDDICIAFIIKNCSQLKSLNVRNCRKLTDNTMQLLTTQKSVALTALNVGGNFNMTAEGLESFFQQDEFVLRELYIPGLPINDKHLEIISMKYTELRSLSIAYSDVQESSLVALCSALGPKLEYLNLSWLSCQSEAVHPQLSFSCLLELMTLHCPKVIELDVSGLKTLGAIHLLRLIELKLQQVRLCIYCCVVSVRAYRIF